MPMEMAGWKRLQLITAIVQYLAHNPASLQAFLNLHHGDYTPVSETRVDGRPVVDTFFVELIVRKNCFNTQRSSRDVIAPVAKHRKEEAEEDVQSGIWLTASYINHDCIGNCNHAWIGDVQIVRAERDLEAGTELCYPYVLPGTLEGQKELQARNAQLGFQCNCGLCHEIQNMPAWMLSCRRALRDEAVMVMEHTGDLAKLGRVLSTFEQLCSDNEALGSRMELLDCYFYMAGSHLMQGHVIEAAEGLVKTLEMQGLDVVASPPRRRVGQRSRFEIRARRPMGLVTAIILAKLVAPYKLLAPELVEPVTNYARAAYRIDVGEDDTFDEEFRKM